MKDIFKRPFRFAIPLFLGLGLSIILFFLIFRFDGLSKGFSRFMSILAPFIYGGVIAYLIKTPYNWVENRLVKLFKGKKLCDIRKSASEYEEKFGAYREIFERIIDAIENYVKEKSGDVFLEGEDKILKHPEYSDIDKVKNFLSVVSDKDKIQRILSDEDDIEISIKIGGETESEIPSDCSLVTATYLAGGKRLGTYGVLGPVRMDYQKVISVLEGVGRILEDLMEDK